MYERFGKRVLDLLVATAALIVLSPVLIITTILIKLDSPGGVLFRQKRSGKNRKPFTIYKFRSMASNAPSNMATNDFKDADAYITRIGKVIRKLSIDELPQLINVVKGDMSIVGPRPVVLSETVLLNFRDKTGANKVRPGVTGWAQVNGRDNLKPLGKAKLDGFYAERIGFIFDIKCILLTAVIVLSMKGHSEGFEKLEAVNEKGVIVREN